MVPPEETTDNDKPPRPPVVSSSRRDASEDSGLSALSGISVPSLDPVPSGLSPPRGNQGFSMNDARTTIGLEHPLAGPGLSPRPPLPTGRHNRKVSWEASSVPLSTVVQTTSVDSEDEDVSYISNPDFRSYSQKSPETSDDPFTNPLESEAESLIQNALDDLDPTKAGPSDAQQSILGFVPEETEPETFSANDNASKNLPKPSMKRAATYSAGRKKEDAAESLFHLAQNLTMLNQQHGLSASKIFVSNNDTGDSNQDKLMENAANLMKRGKDKVGDSGSVADARPASEASSSSAKDRWTTLKTAVSATSTHDMSKSGSNEDAEENHSNTGDDEDDDVESQRSSGGTGRSPSTRGQRKRNLRSRYRDFEDWLRFRKVTVYTYLKNLLMFLVLPAIGVAAILFYLGGNPPCGTKSECMQASKMGDQVPLNTTNSTEGETITDLTKQIFGQASASWWVLFICCRQPVTLTLALATQAFIVEFLVLRTKWAVKLVGPFVTLFIVQSKGWPFVMFWWSVYNFIMLYGSSRWARHWLYWQEYVDLFNEANPAGAFTSAPEYRTVLIVVLVVTAIVGLKRFWVGFWFGKKTFQRYADDLASVMKKSLLIGLVAGLAKDKAEEGFDLGDLGLDVTKYDLQAADKDEETSKDSRGLTPSGSQQGFGFSDESRGSNMLRKASRSSFQRIRIDKLLGSWEEPEIVTKASPKAPIAAIIQFRQSLSYLNTAFPFSFAFGPASTRTECIASAEGVYNRLAGTNKMLRFDQIASLAIKRNGEIDEETVKELIKLFRPERDGSISLIQFAKSIDTIYKELRLLRASVSNSTKMDASFEAIFNVVFYFILICIVLSIIGIDPVVLFASVSGFAIGFAFMIGSACSKFFEGMLFITVRRPYDIGDRINVSEPTVDTDYTGAPGWIVKDVDLFTTTVLYASTNEVATYANSSLASCRIINAARSSKAVVIFMIKFPLDTTYKKLKVYKGAVEEFIKARPREWRSLLAFRANRVEVDAGFVEYIVVGEHREGWQQTGDILTSKANLTSFCLELSKKMNMRYSAPSLPVDLTYNGAAGSVALPTISERVPFSPSSGNDGEPVGRERSGTVESVDWRAVSAMFEQKK